MGPTVDNPEPDFFRGVAVEHRIDGRGRPADTDPAPLLHIGSHATSAGGAVAVSALKIQVKLGTPLEGYLVELLHESVLTTLLTDEVDGQRERQDPGEHHRRGQGLVQAFGLERVVGDSRRQVGGQLSFAATSHAVGNQEGKPGDSGQDGDGGDDGADLPYSPIAPQEGRWGT